MSSEPDELYTLRNLFWLGNYQVIITHICKYIAFIATKIKITNLLSYLKKLAINEANGLTRCPAALVPERDEFLYRSYLALGQMHVIFSEIKDTSPPGNVMKIIIN